MRPQALHTIFQASSLCNVQERKSSLNIKFWAGYPADVRLDIRADVPTQKLSPHRSEHRIFFFCADGPYPKARTSMTREGLRRSLCRKVRADSSFPKQFRMGVYFKKDLQIVEVLAAQKRMFIKTIFPVFCCHCLVI